MNPPKHLSREAKSIWRKVLEGYELEDWHCRVLQSALEAWDRMQQARETLAADGVTYTDRFGAPRKHPAVSIEENSRVAFLRAMRELDLEAETVSETRPPNLKRYR